MHVHRRLLLIRHPVVLDEELLHSTEVLEFLFRELDLPRSPYFPGEQRLMRCLLPISTQEVKNLKRRELHHPRRKIVEAHHHREESERENTPEINRGVYQLNLLGSLGSESHSLLTIIKPHTQEIPLHLPQFLHLLLGLRHVIQSCPYLLTTGHKL